MSVHGRPRTAPPTCSGLGFSPKLVTVPGRDCVKTLIRLSTTLLHCSSEGRRFDSERSSASKLSESNVHGMCRVFLHSLDPKHPFANV
jgi:hypothetical protein